MGGDRPTSGKHFARVGPGKLSELSYLADNPLNSMVADKYRKTKEVEQLLNKLAGYMAGDIPLPGADEPTTTNADQKPDLETQPKRHLGFLKHLEPIRYSLLERPKQDPVPMDIDNSDYEVDDGLPKIQEVQEIQEAQHETQETFLP